MLEPLSKRWEKSMYKIILPILIVFSMICMTSNFAFSEVKLTQGQTVYVSAYPHVFMGPREHIYALAVTLVIRNTDLSLPISVTTVDYYDTQGKLTKKFLSNPVTLNPMASTYIHIKEKDTSGGIGSNFIVRWKAERKVNTPVIEAVMIGEKSGQGISFISPGQEISE